MTFVSARALFKAGVLTLGAFGPWQTGLAAQADSAPSEQHRIDTLTHEMQRLQSALQMLLDQNKSLLERQQQLEEQVARLSATSASPGTTSVPAVPADSVSGTSAQAPPAPAAVPPANPVPATMPSAGPVPPIVSSSPAAPGSSLGGVRLWGYGEIYYTRPVHDPKLTQADLARAVFGIGYSFDARTEFNSEFEIEHAVASASDPGEFEVEQFYLDRQLNDVIGLRAGLFLMPFGLLNEHHEPTNFYGVQRNFVETLIIPSTWREGGLNLHGDSPIGVGWNVGVTTGFDLSKWNFAPEFPLYTTALSLEDSDSAPLQATHQELALANAQHLSQYLALAYYGVPGLAVGAAISSGDAAKVPAPPNVPILGNQRVTLWETHARWTPARFDLAALYAHGSIGNLGVANASNPGSPNPIPSDFYGYYLQAAYNLWEHHEYRLVPFLRYERYNLGSSYEGTPGPVVPTGLVPVSASPGDYGYWPVNRDRVWTVGTNFYTTPHVVWKLDYQRFLENGDFTRFDLGLGLNF